MILNYLVGSIQRAIAGGGYHDGNVSDLSVTPAFLAPELNLAYTPNISTSDYQVTAAFLAPELVNDYHSSADIKTSDFVLTPAFLAPELIVIRQ